MTTDCRQELPDATVMIRGLRRHEISGNGRVKKDAFIPRTNGNDDDGISVSQPAQDCLDTLKQRLFNKDGLFATLLAGEIRSVQEDATTLNVCPDRTEFDSYHALIIGIPASKAGKALATRLAEKLAQKAQLYAPPC